MKKISGIYSITNLVNNKKYIGQSINIHDRWIRHKYQLNTNSHDNIVLQRAWNKYGKNSFKFEIILECIKSQLKLNEKIQVEKIAVSKRYNISKDYNNLVGKNNPFYGKKHTSTTKQKLSIIAKQRTGSKNANYGNNYSKKTKIKAGHNKKTKLTIKQVNTIIKIKNKTHQEIANMYGVSRTMITRIKNGTRWNLLTNTKEV